ncbi:MAG: hemerythrin domain-containing protein [Planctomycetota bacterium]|jgi:hypothetical protein
MSELIEAFKKEHSVITDVLKEVEELGILTKEGQDKLMALSAVLLRHLWDEDERFYPVLREASERNKKLKEILSFFVNGLGGIYEEMLEFFSKYSKGVIDSNFLREYERLFDAFNKRREYEENILYDEYNMLNQ